MPSFSKITRLILGTILIVSGFLITPNITKAATFDDQYPKLANYYLGWDINSAKITELSKWNLVILSSAGYTRNPSVVSELRRLNPKITVLVYVVSQEALSFGPTLEQGNYFKEIFETVDANNWWLYNGSGQRITTWPGAYWINTSNNGRLANGMRFNDWLAQRSVDRFITNGPFDGIFYDNVFDNVAWASKDIDINNDGRADDPDFVNQEWQKGMTELISKTKQLAPGKIILANTNTNFYNGQMNGRMQEHFPRLQEGSWVGAVDAMLNNNIGMSPKIFLTNSDNNNLDDQFSAIKKFRYTYATALLGDSFYSFDVGDKTHASTWWFDEYNIHLGKSAGQPDNVLDTSSALKNGVWRKEYENGTILVNSTNQAQTVDLGAELEKIKGTQDPSVNDGAIIRKITLQPNDGIILQKRVGQVNNTVFQNGSFLKAFTSTGETLQRNSFFAFDRQFAGNNNVGYFDIDKDGKFEKIVADKSKVTVYNQDLSLRASFYPYGSGYKLGINMAIGDLDNNGTIEIVTGTRNGFQPLVKIYSTEGKELNKGFMAYAATYKGGVNVAIANLNGNGIKDIVVGAGYMGGPQVRIFNKDGKLVSGGFFAYAPTFRGGVYVAAGDTDGDGKDEIITGAGTGGSSHIRTFNNKGQSLGKGFWAFGETERKGVQVMATDLDGDKRVEILAINPSPF